MWLLLPAALTLTPILAQIVHPNPGWRDCYARKLCDHLDAKNYSSPYSGAFVCLTQRSWVTCTAKDSLFPMQVMQVRENEVCQKNVTAKPQFCYVEQRNLTDPGSNSDENEIVWPGFLETYDPTHKGCG